MRQSANRPVAEVASAAPLEIYDMPGHLIRRLHQASTAIFAAETAPAGFDLTSVQFAALTVIDAWPGLDQATLAGAIAYDRVTIGGVIDRLEQKGLVRREIARGDRRSRRLHLQPAGRALLDKVTPMVRRAQRRMLAGLSEKDGATLLRLLRKALEAVGDTSRAPLRPVPPG
ncbi:MAG: MarR family transcriptional regulator [Alphaproteobacteria bacterium]|nr:MarR family transcriptional regulator [Alphaproteobacteria bacterium]